MKHCNSYNNFKKGRVNFCKFVLFLIFLLASTTVFAQTSFLKEASEKLRKSLINKDTVTLKQLLHKNTSYGHSSGWVQTKQDVINDLGSGKLGYSKIENEQVKWITDKDWASARSTTNVVVVVDGKTLELKLHILEVWLKTNKGWQLIARQSARI